MAYMAVTAEQIVSSLRRKPGHRGLSVYHISELMRVTGRWKEGQIITGTYQRPVFSLDPMERVQIFQSCSAVMGIVTSRMNRIAALEWTVVPESKVEDRVAAAMKDWKEIAKEYEGVADRRAMVTRALFMRQLIMQLPELLPDLSNFNSALYRWKRRIKERHEDRSTEIEDWLQQPNQRDNFGTFQKKSVFDLLVQGSVSVYKEARDKRLENFYMLPGGTVVPMKGRYVGSAELYAQVVPAAQEVQIYGPDELTYITYIPSSAQDYGFVPLDALINKLAESMMFDRLSAEQADGTKPPELLVIFSEKAPFGDLDQNLDVPLDEKEQKRIETLVNEVRKGAVKVLSGLGSTEPKVVNLTKSDTFPYYTGRQQQIKEDIALVFNMSNLEMNLTGSADTSGRATSESEERIDRSRGIFPVMKLHEDFFNYEIIPFRFGTGYRMQYKSGLSEFEEIKLNSERARSGLYGVNQIRTDFLGEDPFPDEKYDRPGEAQQPQAPAGTEEEPIFTQGSRRR